MVARNFPVEVHIKDDSSFGAGQECLRRYILVMPQPHAGGKLMIQGIHLP